MVIQEIPNIAFQCPHCFRSQLWNGFSQYALVSCKYCRGILLIQTSKEPELEERDGYTISRNFPQAILEGDQFIPSEKEN